jgi:hypothetical protein
MPYPGVPKGAATRKMDRQVKAIRRTGKSKQSAIKIAMASRKKGRKK